jgi:predicted AAA+ superfamily ATPase
MMIALTGQRRVGKSFVLRELAETIRERFPKANIVYINKEKKAFADIKDDADLSAYLTDKFSEDGENFLLIDEVQDIEGFENTLRSLNADEECQIIVTGSNAKMLSSELSTYLGGRYIDIHVQSLSYKEFLRFHQLEDSQESLDKYLNFGGLPHLYRIGLDNEDLVWEYVQNIYNTIELTPLTAINYLKAATNAYIINRVPRYDIHGKRLLETNDKFYFEDLGLRNLLVGDNRAKDVEKVMENAVYLHLKNLGYKVMVGALPNGEIDFVAEKMGRTVYFQVTYLLSDEATVEREFGNLMRIQNNYPKYVVSMDPISKSKDYEGITQLSLRAFLLTEAF